MLVKSPRHALLFCLLIFTLLFAGVVPETLGQTNIEVKVLEEALAIEVPKDSSVLLEAKYVAVVKGVGDFFYVVPFQRLMEHAQTDLGPVLTKEYGRTVLTYVNNQLYGIPPAAAPSDNIGLRFSPQAFATPARPSTRVAQPAPFGPGGFAPGGVPGASLMGPMGMPPGMAQPAPPAARSRSTARTRRKARSEQDSPGPGYLHEFRILAETPERAEELARALITAYDNYVQSKRRRQQDWLSKCQARLPELQLALEKAEEEERKVSGQLSGLEPMPEQVYEELKTKEWTLRVEMAGVEGRLKAARKLIAENDKPAAQVAEQISITSEIELAGLLQQLSTIDGFLKRYHSYTRLKAQQKSASAGLNRAKYEKGETERNIESIKKTLEEQLVPFELIEPVQIRPIEWKKAS